MSILTLVNADLSRLQVSTYHHTTGEAFIIRNVSSAGILISCVENYGAVLKCRRLSLRLAEMGNPDIGKHICSGTIPDAKIP